MLCWLLTWFQKNNNFYIYVTNSNRTYMKSACSTDRLIANRSAGSLVNRCDCVFGYAIFPEMQRRSQWRKLGHCMQFSRGVFTSTRVDMAFGGREARARRLLAGYWRPVRLRAHHPLAVGQLNTALPAAYPRRIDGKLLNTRHPLRDNATANPHLITTPNCILKTMLRTHHNSWSSSLFLNLSIFVW